MNLTIHYTHARKHCKHLMMYSKHLLFWPEASACLLTASTTNCKNCTIATRRAPKARLPKWNLKTILYDLAIGKVSY